MAITKEQQIEQLFMGAASAIPDAAFKGAKFGISIQEMGLNPANIKLGIDDMIKNAQLGNAPEETFNSRPGPKQ